MCCIVLTFAIGCFGSTAASSFLVAAITDAAGWAERITSVKLLSGSCLVGMYVWKPEGSSSDSSLTSATTRTIFCGSVTLPTRATICPDPRPARSAEPSLLRRMCYVAVLFREPTAPEQTHADGRETIGRVAVLSGNGLLPCRKCRPPGDVKSPFIPPRPRGRLFAEFPAVTWRVRAIGSWCILRKRDAASYITCDSRHASARAKMKCLLFDWYVDEPDPIMAAVRIPEEPGKN